MNLANRPPLGQKAPKAKLNPRYLARVRELPCIICDQRPCEAHHPICDRYSQVRVPDDMAVPLCPDCHRELHADKRAWAEKYGADHEYVAATRDRLERDT